MKRQRDEEEEDDDEAEEEAEGDEVAAERSKRESKEEGEGMCPKRRMHAETRKRYIRGLAAGDGRPRPSFFYLYV